MTTKPKVPDEPTNVMQHLPTSMMPETPVEPDPDTAARPIEYGEDFGAIAPPAPSSAAPIPLDAIHARLRKLEDALRPFAKIEIDQNETPDQAAYILAKRGPPVKILNKDVLAAREILET